MALLSFMEQPRSTSQSIRARSPQAAARLAQPAPSNPSARAHSTSGKSPEAGAVVRSQSLGGEAAKGSRGGAARPSFIGNGQHLSALAILERK